MRFANRNCRLALGGGAALVASMLAPFACGKGIVDSASGASGTGTSSTGSGVPVDANDEDGSDAPPDGPCVTQCGAADFCCAPSCKGSDGGFCVQSGDVCQVGNVCCTQVCGHCDGGFGTCE